VGEWHLSPGVVAVCDGGGLEHARRQVALAVALRDDGACVE
jgi:hypothetical protein